MKNSSSGLMSKIPHIGSAYRIALISCVLMLISAGCSSTSNSSSEDQLTVKLGAIAKVPIYWPFYGAVALGYAKEEGIKLDIVTIDEPGCLRGMVSGSLDVCPTGGDSVIRTAELGAGIKIFATDIDPTRNSIIVDPKKIQSWGNLKGKVISAQAPKVGSSVIAAATMAANGLDPKDVTFLTVGGTAARYAALVSGKVDAAIVSQPQDFIAVDEGYAVLGRADDSTSLGTYMSSIPKGQSAEMAEAIQRLRRAMQRANDWLKDPDNRDAAIDLWAKEFKMKPQYAEQSIDLIAPGFDTSVDLSSIKRDIKITARYGGVERTIPAEELVDNRD